MRLPWRRDEPQSGVVVAIVSGACCMPGMAPFDEQAKKVIEQAISETGVEAHVHVMPATKAFFGGLPKEIMGQLVSSFQRGQMPVPAVLVNGKFVSQGVPKVEDVKAALLAANERAEREASPRDESSALAKGHRDGR